MRDVHLFKTHRQELATLLVHQSSHVPGSVPLIISVLAGRSIYSHFKVLSNLRLRTGTGAFWVPTTSESQRVIFGSLSRLISLCSLAPHPICTGRETSSRKFWLDGLQSWGHLWPHMTRSPRRRWLFSGLMMSSAPQFFSCSSLATLTLPFRWLLLAPTWQPWPRSQAKRW